VYDHAGEGDYDKTELAIQKVLKERADRLGMDTAISGTVNVTPVVTKANSPETYFGFSRNQFLASGKSYTPGTQTLDPIIGAPKGNLLYLSGTWNFNSEYAENTSVDARIVYNYTAMSVYFVASAQNEVAVTVLRDGVPLPSELRGKDVDANGQAHIKESRLYDLVNEKDVGTHTLELRVEQKGLDAFTFTFG
jgi:Thioredoxin like C-terminal domain